MKWNWKRIVEETGIDESRLKLSPTILSEDMMVIRKYLMIDGKIIKGVWYCPDVPQDLTESLKEREQRIINKFDDDAIKFIKENK